MAAPRHNPGFTLMTDGSELHQLFIPSGCSRYQQLSASLQTCLKRYGLDLASLTPCYAGLYRAPPRPAWCK